MNLVQEILESAVAMMTALRRNDDPKGATDQSAGGGGVIVLEAGMGQGKTRVLEELAARARGAGMLVLSGRSDAGRAGQVTAAARRRPLATALAAPPQPPRAPVVPCPQCQRNLHGSVRVQSGLRIQRGRRRPSRTCTRPLAQVLHPWRRVFRDVFAIDEAAAALSGLRSQRATGRPPADGDAGLGRRCRERVPDYEAMLPKVCEALELPKRIALALLPAPSSPATPSLPQVFLLCTALAPCDVLLMFDRCSTSALALQASGIEPPVATLTAGRKRALPSSPFAAAAGDADAEAGPQRR